MYKIIDTVLRDFTLCQITTGTKKIPFFKFIVKQSGKTEVVTLTYSKHDTKEKLEELFEDGIILKTNRESHFLTVNQSILPERVSVEERDYYNLLVSESREHVPKEEEVPVAV